MRLAWATDIHFDSTPDPNEAAKSLGDAVRRQNVEGLIVTGDISTGQTLILHLSQLEREVQLPIYFVLGNHDVWCSSIEATHNQMKELSRISPFLKWLPSTSYRPVSSSTTILGHDGWYDAMNGDFRSSSMSLVDWQAVHDFRQIGGPANKGAIVSLSRKLANAASTHIMRSIKEAVKYSSTIIVCTHVPPFVEACMHGGHKTDNDALPWYTNSSLGTVLRAAGIAYPKKKFICLAGHTHTKASFKVSHNVLCLVGGSEYGNPSLNDVIEVP